MRWMVIVVVVVCAGACKKSRPHGVPEEHRGSAAVCAPNPHAAHQPRRKPDGSAACRTNADCTAKPNGICADVYIGQGDWDVQCDYDECMSDADCKAGPCICGGSADVNTCGGGLCRVDADCMGSYCSPSADDCGWGRAGWYCHTADDECANDKDCAAGSAESPEDYCSYDPKKRHWGCRHGRCQD